MHILMIILHILALLFGFFGLFITIPLHLILTTMNKKQDVKVVYVEKTAKKRKSKKVN